MVYRDYGSPERLTLEDVARPEPADDEVLVEVEAVSLNASDWELLNGSPSYTRIWGLCRPRHQVLGSDIAGRVAALGKAVTRFRPGDAVFGDVFERWGGLAEFALASESALLRKPDELSFEQAAAIPQSAVLALQGLRQGRRQEPGHRVLINGAGGGAGTFAIQLAKYLGAAEVTGVDHTRKLDRMRSLGADRVIDYMEEDFTRNGGRYDRIVDFAASRSILDCARALTPTGVYVLAGGSVRQIVGALVLGSVISALHRKSLGLLMHRQSRSDMELVVRLCEAGDVRPVIDRLYPLGETAEAFRQLGEGRAFGKVVITP